MTATNYDVCMSHSEAYEWAFGEKASETSRVLYSVGFLDLIRVFIEGKGGRVFRSWKHSFKLGIFYRYTCELPINRASEVIRYLRSMDISYETGPITDDCATILIYAKHTGGHVGRDM